MIADINITEKSFGPKSLMTGVRFSIDDGEKVGVVGRNGIGKSTLFGILAGTDKDYSGSVVYRRGVSMVATSQEYIGVGEQTVMQYILAGLPEYAELSHIIATYPDTMGDDIAKIEEFTSALERFDARGFYQIEEVVERELNNFQLSGVANRQFSTLSGGQKRLSDVVKVMHSDAHLALVDEPTNHMDYIAKQQFIDWMKTAHEAMLVITHDRDVLAGVDRIIELRDGGSVSYSGNYDSYLRQNASRTSAGMSDFENVEKRIVNLKQKVTDYQRLKEKSRNPATIQKFKRLEGRSREELSELQAVEKPTFWIDRGSVGELDYKSAGRYEKFKSRNIRMSLRDGDMRSQRVLVSARGLSLGYGTPLFDGVNIDLREGEALELRGRNGAGKSTLIRALLARDGLVSSDSVPSKPAASREAQLFAGELHLDTTVRTGIYEQEISLEYFELTLHDAIERIYLGRDLPISETRIRSLMSDYLFNESDGQIPVSKLSGGQKARLQIISMLANEPQLLILDEPTNHLDLPSIEELEAALERYSGAVLFVSHDTYFRNKLDGDVVQIGSNQ